MRCAGDTVLPGERQRTSIRISRRRPQAGTSNLLRQGPSRSDSRVDGQRAVRYRAELVQLDDQLAGGTSRECWPETLAPLQFGVPEGVARKSVLAERIVERLEKNQEFRLPLLQVLRAKSVQRAFGIDRMDDRPRQRQKQNGRALQLELLIPADVPVTGL